MNRIDANRVDSFNRHSIKNDSSDSETKDECCDNKTNKNTYSNNIETNYNSYLASMENIPRAVLVTSENELSGKIHDTYI